MSQKRINLEKGFFEGRDTTGLEQEIFNKENLNIKHICLRLGESISFQKNTDDRVHFISLNGEVNFTIGTCLKLVFPNETISIPKGEKITIENKENMAVNILRVETINPADNTKKQNKTG